jgi:hypothetical protein
VKTGARGKLEGALRVVGDPCILMAAVVFDHDAVVVGANLHLADEEAGLARLDIEIVEAALAANRAPLFPAASIEIHVTVSGG